MPRRRCLGFAECGRMITSGSWCPAHRRSHKAARNAEAPRAAAVVANAILCELCGEPARVGDPITADHVVPMSKGGAGGELRPAHRSCNSKRGARL